MSASTGSANTGSANTRSARTGSARTGSAGTGSAGTGSAGTGSAAPAAERRDSRRWWALAAVSLAAFMTYLDNNITNVAIPTIQHSLHLSVSGLEWVVSSYLLTVAGLRSEEHTSELQSPC